MTGSTEETDVGVVSLTDRRRILALEAQVNDLSAKLQDALGRAKPGIERKPNTECYHQGGFLVSDHNLEVECQRCGAKMDPYVVLRKIAHREVNFCYTLNGLRTERDQLAKEVESLKGRRARLRAQVSKATPDVGVDAVASAMEAIGADTFLLRKVGGQWGAWFHYYDTSRAASPATRTPREAVSSIIEVAESRRVK